MLIKMAQIVVSHGVEENKQKILSALNSANPEEWVVFPECALTGYFPEEEGFLKDVDPNQIDQIINEIVQKVKEKKCYCLLGTALYIDDVWHNSVVMFSHDKDRQVYKKIELSDIDKNHFNKGDELPIYEMGGITFGVQICRELLFPLAWAKLKDQGAQVIFHINNAIKPYDNIWEHIVIARAVENSVFVCSVNNAAEPQELMSYLVDPSGKELLKAEKQQDQILTGTIKPDLVLSPY